MIRKRGGMRRLLEVTAFALLSAVSGTAGWGQGATPGGVSPIPGVRAALAWSARVEVLDSGGKTLRAVNGTLVDAGVIVQTSALAGATRVRATSRDGRKWESERALAVNELLGLCVLELPGKPPRPVVFPENRSYMANSRVYLLNGPGFTPDSLSARIHENFMIQGSPDLCPTDIGITGAAPAVDGTGRFLGVACDLSEGPYRAGYIVPTGSIQVLATSLQQAQPIAGLAAAIPPPFEDRNADTGLLFRGAVLTQVEKYDDARHFLGLALTRSPKSPEVHFWNGRALFAQEQFLQAAEEFQVAGTEDPTFHMAWHMAGAALNQARDYAGAEKMYHKALEAEPNNAGTYCNLGGAYYNMQRIDEALVAFRKSIELDPRYAQGLAYMNLAVVLSGRGRQGEAEQVYQDLLKVNPVWAQRLRDTLDGKH